MPDSIDALIAKGRKEFADFDDRSAFVAGVASDVDELRQALAEVPDSHRVVADLADDPDEALRILKLRGTRLGAELGRYSAARAAKAAPAPVAAAPKAVPEPDVYDDKLSARDYAAAMRQREQKRRADAAALPANRDLSDPKMPMEDFVKLRDRQAAERRAARRAR